MHEGQRFLGRVLGEAAKLTLFTDVIHTQNLRQAQRHLSEQGSVLLLMNHWDRLDAAVLGKVLTQDIGPIGNHMSILVARKYLDPEREEHKIVGRAIIYLQQAYGFNLLPIVQGIPEERDRYDDWRKTNKDSINRAIDALRGVGNIVGVTPEGTRSKTGQLLEAERGVEILLRWGGEKVLVQPIAGVPVKIRPLVMRTRIIVPPPFTYAQLLAEQAANPGRTVTDLVMLRIARELPEKNRGHYKID